MHRHICIEICPVLLSRIISVFDNVLFAGIGVTNKSLITDDVGLSLAVVLFHFTILAFNDNLSISLREIDICLCKFM